MTFTKVKTERRGRVGIVTLNRPEQMNALSGDLVDELFAAVEEFNADDNTRAMVLTGEGRAFCAGADVQQWKKELLDDQSDGAAPATHRLVSPEEGWTQLALKSKPIVAAINGVAIGGGLTLTLSCDVRLAAEEARFSTRFVRVGLVPELGSSRLLAQTIGLGRAMDLVLTCRMVSAQEAEAMNLVNRVVPAEELMSTALSVAEEMAYSPSSSLLAAKRVMWANLFETSMLGVLRRESQEMSELRQQPAHKEAVRAFAEKREPDFASL